MSAADELRQAAETLRTLAQNATAGPWEGSERIVWTTALHDSVDDTIVSDGPDGHGGFVDECDAAYVATMHPGVGLALADWLDDAAQIYENEVNGGYGVSLKRLRGPLSVARLINGGAR